MRYCGLKPGPRERPLVAQEGRAAAVAAAPAREGAFFRRSRRVMMEGKIAEEGISFNLWNSRDEKGVAFLNLVGFISPR